MVRKICCLLVTVCLLGSSAWSEAADGWSAGKWRKSCAKVRTTYNPDRPLKEGSLTLGIFDPRWEDFLFWAVTNGILNRSIAGVAGGGGLRARKQAGAKLRWAQGTRWERTVEYSFGYVVALLVGEHGWRDVQFAQYFQPLGGTYDYNIKDRLYLLDPDRADPWIAFLEYLADREGPMSTYALAQPVLVDVGRERVIYRGGQGVGYEVGYERVLQDLRDVLDDCRIFEFLVAYDTYGQGFASRPGWAQRRASAAAKLAFRANVPEQPVEGAAKPGASGARRGPVCENGHAAEIYRRNCAVCHGERGGGDGLAAASLEPRPRDLSRAVFKIRSTPSGSPPTDRDLVRVISKGLPGTAMPAWSQFLSREEIEAVAECIKELSPNFAAAKRVEPLPVKVPQAPQDDSLFNGATQWRRLGCPECHGGDGRGLGPRALDLKDDNGVAVLPTDLTNKWLFRGGYAPEDVYLRLVTGMDGTPMKSYLGLASERDLWDLVNYVLDLSPKRRPQVTPRATDMPP